MRNFGIVISALVALTACSPAEPPVRQETLSPKSDVPAAVSADRKASEPDAADAPAPQEAATTRGASRADRVQQYAVVLGRAAGCGMDIEPYGAPVGMWISRTTSGTEESNLSVLFMGQVIASRDQQRAGQTGLTCMQAVDAIDDTNWPR